MRETAPEMVGDRFWDPFWKRSDKVRKWCQRCSKSGLEKMELDGFWVVVAPYGLGLAVVRGTGPKFHYRPLFGHIGPLGAQNGSFLGFWGHFGFLASPWPIVAYCPPGRRHGRSLFINPCLARSHCPPHMQKFAESCFQHSQARCGPWPT